MSLQQVSKIIEAIKQFTTQHLQQTCTSQPLKAQACVHVAAGFMYVQIHLIFTGFSPILGAFYGFNGVC